MFRTFTLTLALTMAAAGEAPSYPCFRGADGSGGGGPVEGKLITEIAKAKLVWESEERQLPSSYGFIMGGAGGPVVADGTVFVYYAFPSGEVDEPYFTKQGNNGVPEPKKQATSEAMVKAMGFASVADLFRAKCALRSDDTLLAVDLTTGKTKWKQVWTGTGVNRSKSGRGAFKWNKTGPHIIPAAAYGKVCSLLDRGALVCLDAATGKELWRQGDLSPYEPGKKEPGSYNNGVVLFGGGNFICQRGEALVAHQADSGKEAWRVEAAAGGRGGGAVHCVLHGKEVIISNRGLIIDPASGKTLYQVQTAGDRFPVIGGDIAVFMGSENGGPIRAYRLLADRGEQLWENGDLKVQDLTPVVLGSRVVFKATSATAETMSRFVSIDLATGKDVRSTDDYRSDGCGGSTGAGGQILLYDRCIVHVDAAGTPVRDPEGSLRSDNDPDWTASHTAAVVGHLLVTRGQNSVKCFDLRAR